MGLMGPERRHASHISPMSPIGPIRGTSSALPRRYRTAHSTALEDEDDDEYEDEYENPGLTAP